jgi:hypothetical protein
MTGHIFKGRIVGVLIVTNSLTLNGKLYVDTRIGCKIAREING